MLKLFAGVTSSGTSSSFLSKPLCWRNSVSSPSLSPLAAGPALLRWCFVHSPTGSKFSTALFTSDWSSTSDVRAHFFAALFSSFLANCLSQRSVCIKRRGAQPWETGRQRFTQLRALAGSAAGAAAGHPQAGSHAVRR
uniref:Uncharacterized protein n=1 Tax=Molossus molossus TaxID=27622 RepID=A0A7J8JWU1_MOLMO|nr:hypothetical protein HJG59_007994 [Molossus molossus]